MVGGMNTLADGSSWASRAAVVNNAGSLGTATARTVAPGAMR